MWKHISGTGFIPTGIINPESVTDVPRLDVQGIWLEHRRIYKVC